MKKECTFSSSGFCEKCGTDAQYAFVDIYGNDTRPICKIQSKKTMKKEINDLKCFMREIYELCDSFRTEETKEINEIFEITCIALEIGP